MANQRRAGLVHVGAWIEEELHAQIRALAELKNPKRPNKTQIVIEILSEQVALELEKIPLAKRRKAIAANRQRRPRPATIKE